MTSNAHLLDLAFQLRLHIINGSFDSKLFNDYLEPYATVVVHQQPVPDTSPQPVSVVRSLQKSSRRNDSPPPSTSTPSKRRTPRLPATHFSPPVGGPTEKSTNTAPHGSHVPRPKRRSNTVSGVSGEAASPRLPRSDAGPSQKRRRAAQLRGPNDHAGTSWSQPIDLENPDVEHGEARYRRRISRRSSKQHAAAKATEIDLGAAAAEPLASRQPMFDPYGPTVLAPDLATPPVVPPHLILGSSEDLEDEPIWRPITQPLHPGMSFPRSPENPFTDPFYPETSFSQPSDSPSTQSFYPESSFAQSPDSLSSESFYPASSFTQPPDSSFTQPSHPWNSFTQPPETPDTQSFYSGSSFPQQPPDDDSNTQPAYPGSSFPQPQDNPTTQSWSSFPQRPPDTPNTQPSHHTSSFPQGSDSSFSQPWNSFTQPPDTPDTQSFYSGSSFPQQPPDNATTQPSDPGSSFSLLPNTRAALEVQYAEELRQMSEMGFSDVEENLLALRLRGNLDSAMDYLLEAGSIIR
ncbi:MAG: hypothetical protein Q9186_001930 [Xanthomendoza sp. 1 TL-2023]